MLFAGLKAVLKRPKFFSEGEVDYVGIVDFLEKSMFLAWGIFLASSASTSPG